MRALIGTRKGLLVLSQSGASWQTDHFAFPGIPVNITLQDRQGGLWAGLHHGHWGPKLHYSADGGATFVEKEVPSFPKDTELSLKGIWQMFEDPKGRLYLGAEPAGLFFSDDRAASWHFCDGLLGVPHRDMWFGAGTDASCLHSILSHPDNPHHLLVGISVAGVLQSQDRGQTWRYTNRGCRADYLPDPGHEAGHDPHLIVADPEKGRRLWQQNHCGLLVSDDFGEHWQNLSEKPGLVSAFGWAIAANNQGAVFTVPSQADECRQPNDLALCVQVSRDLGQSWQQQRRGLPQEHCFDICYRHALDARDDTVMFGSSTGNLYFSHTGGQVWHTLANHLAPIYSVQLVCDAS